MLDGMSTKNCWRFCPQTPRDFLYIPQWTRLGHAVDTKCAFRNKELDVFKQILQNSFETDFLSFKVLLAYLSDSKISQLDLPLTPFQLSLSVG